MKISFLHSGRLLAAYACALTVLLSLSTSSWADTVKLKSGETLEGKITYEGSDYIKLEVAVSATIKDTKLIVRGDIAEIIKAAPDDVALSELRKKLPVPSLTTAPSYRSLIDAGPKRFLEEFPASPHRAEVEKILADISAELDKVERGYIKLEGEWISPQRRKQFKSLTESRRGRILMRRKLAQGNFLGALRDFEILEERHWGGPAYVAAIPDTRKLLPAFGRRLTRALQDVEYRNKKWEKDKALLGEAERAQVERARGREVENFKRAIEREKAAGVKWMSISENSADSLSGAIQLVSSEMERINAIDLAALTTLSEELVKADELIAAGKLTAARKVIKEATAKMGATPGSSSRSNSGKTSYVATLLAKVAEGEKAVELAKKQKEDSAEGEKASSVIKAGEVTSTEPPAPDEGADPGEMPAKTTDGEKSGGDAGEDQGSALTGLMAAGKKPSGDNKTGGAGSKSPGKRTPSPKKDDEGDDDSAADDDWVPPEDDGGGALLTISIIVVVIMVIVLVAMKVLGVGGKKEEE